MLISPLLCRYVADAAAPIFDDDRLSKVRGVQKLIYGTVVPGTVNKPDLTVRMGVNTTVIHADPLL